MSDLSQRLQQLADKLMPTLAYSQYAHTCLEAKAKLERLERECDNLRHELDEARRLS